MAEGKFVVSAQNRIKEGLDAAQKDLAGFEGATKKIGESITRALTVTAIIAGLKKLGEAAFDCYQEFGESERRLKQLKIALDGNEASFRKATSLIDSMRKMSLASKDDIEGLVSELAALGKSDKEIDTITRAAVNLSNVTGKDLNSAFTLINGTYAGTAGKLEKLIPEIGNLSKEQLAAGDAAKLINDKFTTLSTTLAADNIPQRIKNIKDSWGDFNENIGEAITPIFSPILNGIQRVVDGWNDAFQAHKNYLIMSKKLGDEAEENAIKSQIEITKRKQESATALLKQANPMSTGSANDKAEIVFLQAQVDEYARKLRQLGGTLRAVQEGQLKNPTLNTSMPRIVVAGPDGGGGDLSKDVYNRYSAIPSASFFGLDRMGFDADASLELGRSFALAFENIVDNSNDSSNPFNPSSFFSTDRMGFDPEASLQIGNVAALLLDGIAKPFEDFRDDMESYGWTGDELAKPAKEFRDDLESYGWEGLGETAFDRIRKGWAKGIDQGDRPDEGGAYSQRYDASDPGMKAFSDWADSIGKFTRDDMESYGWTAENLAKPVIEFRDDLESYGWDGLGETAFDAFRKGWAKAQDAYNPDEPGTNGIPESVYIRAGANTVAQSVFAQFERVSLEFRDDLENAGWEGLGETAFDAFRVGWAKAQDAYNVDEGGGYTPPVFYNPATAGNTEPTWLDKIGKFLGDLTKNFGATFVNMLGTVSSVMMVIEPLATIASGAMEVLKPFIDEALIPVIGSMKVLGAMLGQILVPVIQFLTPVIVKLAEVFVWLYNNVFRHIGNLIIMVLGGFVNAISGLVRTITFGLVNMGQIDTDSMMMGKIDMSTITTAGISAVSDSTAATSASYRTQAITINIYQSAPVVGSDGMGEFARMIRGELDALAYAGQ